MQRLRARPRPAQVCVGMVACQWLLTSALLLHTVTGHACPGGGCQPEPVDDEDTSRPTRQPPTRGQDMQKCAWYALPEVVNLAPVSSNWFTRNGKWSGKMGAELVNWEQSRVRIDYTNIDYYVDLKPWFHAKVLRNEELELRKMNIWLPPPRRVRNSYGKPIGEKNDEKRTEPSTTVVYADCESTPMYVSREFERGDYEIFNHLGQLVATGAPSELHPGQLYFRDDVGMPFAFAGSPTISEVANPIQGKEWLPQDHLYDFDHWQVWFMDGFNSVSYLKEPDNRWVIAAVVQEHAILNTLMYSPNGDAQTPLQYVAFVGLTIASCLGMVILSCCACGQIFVMVYPPKKSAKGNPFMVEDIGGHPYGSFALARAGYGA